MKRKQDLLHELTKFELAIEFMSFLQGCQCFGSYLLNVLSAHHCTVGRFLYHTSPEDWISSAFVYSDTVEGRQYWRKIYEDWNNVLR